MKSSNSFRRALLIEAVRVLLSEDLQTAKDILVEYINATVGFTALGAALDRPPRTLTRMLAPHGDPKASHLFGIIAYLRKLEGVDFEVTMKPTTAAPARDIEAAA